MTVPFETQAVSNPLDIKNTDEAMAAALFQEQATVDALGVIKAQIAELEQKEKALTDALKAAGKDSYSGHLFDCTVSRSERESFDMPRLKADLGDVLLEYAKPAVKIVTLRITARK